MTRLSRSAAQLAIGALVLAGIVLGAGTAQAAVDTDPADGVPRTDTPVDYDAFPAISDPGTGSSQYFQPFWYDTQGRQIQAHGGQIVTTQEDGRTVYYWYGEDRTHGYYDSPGVGVYRSTDLHNWEDLGDALRTVSDDAQLTTDPYFTGLYGTLDEQGQPKTALAQSLAYYLNTNQSAPYSAIVERPKVLYNAKNDQWVMWWHADGRTVAGGSTYARSMAGVAVSDSPAGPFKMVGAYRLYNRTDYKACISSAVPGQSRDMTVFQDADGTAYIAYSSEENRSLYIARLDADYTNLEQTTTTDPVLSGSYGGTAAYTFQYSADGRYPHLFADGTPGAPVRGTDFQIVRECGSLEAPAVFSHGGRYYVVASGATGWAPNQQTYYSSTQLMSGWIRGVKADDPYESVAYSAIPEGGDGLLSRGDTRRTTFGSQSTDVLTLAPGEYVYLGDRWDAGASDSTYVWLPITVGEDGALVMSNPAAEDPARWGSGWDASYWDDKGLGSRIWSVAGDSIPSAVRRGAGSLPSTLDVVVDGAHRTVPVTWQGGSTADLGAQTLTGTLAADDDFGPGRQISRAVDVWDYGVANIAPSATVTASSRADLAPKVVDRDVAGKGWDDWVSGGAYPKSSWLAFTWPSAHRASQIVVQTYKDGSSATWPQRIAVQYRDGAGNWVDSAASATLDQGAPTAPRAVIDVSALPETTGIRLNLTTTANTWQSVSEVEIWAAADAQGDVCRAAGTRVSATFWQTEYATMPAASACDGSAATAWSTWASGGKSPAAVSFTVTPATAYTLSRAVFTNAEGSPQGVSVSYRGVDGLWHGTTAQDVPVAAAGTPTTVSFDEVTATAVRLDFATAGTYLKIPELSLDGVPAAPPAAGPDVAVTAATRCVAGKAQVIVTAKNGGSAPATVEVSGGFGAKAFPALAAGTGSSAAFATRQASIPAGSVAFTATADGAGTTGSAPYGAVACG